MTKAVTEVLSISSTFGWKVRCPFSDAEKHMGKCVCRGTGYVKACEKCGGGGWDAVASMPCRDCGGAGAHSVAKK
jgi:hypothetical protein